MLLGNRARPIVAKRQDHGKAFSRLRTAVPDSPQTIGEHIHAKRHALCIHQWQLCKTLGIWRSTLCAWEANRYAPLGQKRQRAVAWLGFDPDERP